jgi:3-oxoacyl-[acyl-carrier-protein] synthase-3
MMKNSTCSVILATGSYIPKRRIRNEDFLESDFYDSNGKKLGKSNREIISKFLEITAIEERRYVIDEHVTSDIAYFAALDALESSKTDKEELDYIIVAHNFGDVKAKSKSLDIVPSLAARVKHKLGIENPATIAYDLPFGCPGWLQGIIQADYYLRSGDAKRILVIGGSYFLGRVFVEEMIKQDDIALSVLNRGKLPLNKKGVEEIVCDRMLADVERFEGNISKGMF